MLEIQFVWLWMVDDSVSVTVPGRFEWPVVFPWRSSLPRSMEAKWGRLHSADNLVLNDTGHYRTGIGRRRADVRQTYRAFKRPIWCFGLRWGMNISLAKLRWGRDLLVLWSIALHLLLFTVQPFSDLFILFTSPQISYQTYTANIFLYSKRNDICHWCCGHWHCIKYDWFPM